MDPNKIVPSRAFCSDESKGLPIILMSKHFGVFPSDHDLVGGIMDYSRHAPHADHGKDMAILQASHIGYEPKTQRFGRYRRLQMEHQHFTPNCGKIHVTLEWHLRSIVLEEGYHGKNLIYISGLKLDYSPDNVQHFPLSHFVPWAAYIQKADGTHYILEQDALYEALMECSDKNEDQTKLDTLIWD